MISSLYHRRYGFWSDTTMSRARNRIYHFLIRWYYPYMLYLGFSLWLRLRLRLILISLSKPPINSRKWPTIVWGMYLLLWAKKRIKLFRRSSSHLRLSLYSLLPYFNCLIPNSWILFSFRKCAVIIS